MKNVEQSKIPFFLEEIRPHSKMLTPLDTTNYCCLENIEGYENCLA